MAEDIVSFVLDKLSDADCKEVLQRHGISEQAEALCQELCWIQFFLKDAYMAQWLGDVSDVAFDIKDVIDNAFLLNDYGNPSKELPRGCSQIIKSTKRMRSKYNRVALHKLADEMNEILPRIREIIKSRKKYGITLLDEGSGEWSRQPIRPLVLPDIDDPHIIGFDHEGSGEWPRQLPIRPLVLPGIDDPHVIGFDHDKDNIVRQLLDTSTKRRTVISIVGPGGIGKSTLARKVYNCNDIKRQFEVRIWVVVSQIFNLMDILRKIIEQVEPLHRNDLEGGESFLLTKLYKTLNGEKYTIEDYLRPKSHEPLSHEKDPQASKKPQPKKYLLVLDDVWRSDLWTLIAGVLPDAEIGNRVIITSRIQNIVNDAEPYKLSYLTEEMSLKLLFKKAMPNRDLRDMYPDHLIEVGKQFVQKSGGLPIALVVFGGLLSTKLASYAAWNRLLETMNWGTDGRACIEIIATSYNDLSYVLKSCFMYFAVFPENHKIIAQSLIRLWIAEGLLHKEKFRTLEDTAESFLEDLVQRSLVEVSKRSHAGSIISCRIHVLLREVAIQKAKEDNFLTICSNPDNWERVVKACRAAVHYSSCSELMEHANLHSLLCFEKPLPNCSRQRYLKVLSDMGQSGPIKFEYFHGLTQLRYCKFSGISNSTISSFESFISGLKFVETLDFHLLVNHPSFPDDIWKVKTLRHVKLRQYMPGPSSSAKLRNLQTLTGVKSRESWNEQLPKLPNVRELDIEVHNSFLWVSFAELLGTLNHLTCLSVVGFDVPQEIVEMRRFPFYQNLQSLSLGEQTLFPNNKLSLEVSMFPIHIVELTLTNLQFQDDPLPELEKLRCLRMLWLQGERTNRKMSCSAGGFEQLRELTFNWLTNLEEWEIEAGAMPEIKLVKLEYCNKLEVPLGLEYLSNLEELKVTGCQLLQMKSNEIRDLCKHVPDISFKGFDS